MFFQRQTITCPISYQSIPLSTPIEELNFVVFDTETTGFQVTTIDRLLEIGAVTIKGLTVCEDDSFQTYINPKRQISREIVELTGITDERVAGSPEAFEAVSSFFDFLQKKEPVCLVGHYVSFDTLTIKSELKREQFVLKNWFTIDTLDLIGFMAPSYDMRDLHRYSMAFGTRIYQRHSAIGDALTTAYLFAELLWQFKVRGFKTWGDLVKATESTSRSML